MAGATSGGASAALLRRRGLVFVDAASGPPAPRAWLAGVELELAELGYVLSARLRARLAALPPAALGPLHQALWDTLAAAAGAHVEHAPLFARFPDDVPADTRALWWRKVLSHFLQAPDQPCLHCGRTGTTHVLRPCEDVVCDRCFDGAAYTACPVCERHVDRSSPFFGRDDAGQALPEEPVRFRLLDLGDDLEAAARALVVSLCERPQPPSPADKDDLALLLAEAGERALGWLPERIPVKETVAAALAALFRACPPAAVLPLARRHLRTATNVLRFIAALSGADPALEPEVVFKQVAPTSSPRRWWGKLAALLGGGAGSVPLRVRRFKVARLPRPLRRALLEVLEGLDPERLCEDMLRHRAWWVWVGEFLHPSEHAARFPNVARAFALVRGGPRAALLPPFHTWSGRLEAAVQAGDVDGALALLRQRPGELARRLDHALRLAGDDEAAQDRVLAACRAHVDAFTTPVLLTLRAHLPRRARPADARIYWPKGAVALGPLGPDRRRPLPPRVIAAALGLVEGELLRRLADRPPLDAVVVDEALRRVVVPFNERTAARAAVALPRGSRLAVPRGEVVRLFLHWCEPAAGGRPTDLDLSVALYDDAWAHVGVCSFYALRLDDAQGQPVATSSGDLRDAPHPDGATEFVDVRRARALALGARYAVMIVNAFAGLPFGRLERAFAGLMLRDDPHGAHFDPRTVALRFDLQGEHGVDLPLVLDLREGTLHWLDVHAQGRRQFNTAGTSAGAISRLCPALMGYFEGGARHDVHGLVLLHAAARARRVVVRGAAGVTTFERAPGEGPPAFLARLQAAEGGAPSLALPDLGAGPVLAALLEGDLDLPPGSACYALLRGRTAPTLAASDLL
ncbi:MAG: hypothetical protein M9894_24485 [Planctomycetes bacterium]|nr:hypothetical protein [Planctomycetota bacterium]